MYAALAVCFSVLSVSLCICPSAFRLRPPLKRQRRHNGIVRVINPPCHLPLDPPPSTSSCLPPGFSPIPAQDASLFNVSEVLWAPLPHRLAALTPLAGVTNSSKTTNNYSKDFCLKIQSNMSVSFVQYITLELLFSNMLQLNALHCVTMYYLSNKAI